MIMPMIKICISIIAAFLLGKLVSKIKLPSILGWLIAGMILGPHSLGVLSDAILNSGWYQAVIHVLECGAGLMIGSELVWKRIKKSGKSIMITTLTQSLGTFLIVSAVFGILFWFCDISLYLALIFGSIALATAPAPALSIVKEFKTKGPVTRTLIPMAALDDMVGVIVFFTTMGIIAGSISQHNLPAYMILVIILFPLAIGSIIGLPTGFLLKKRRSAPVTLAILISMILVTAAAGFVCNFYLMPKPVLNFMLMGMAFSAVFSNIVPQDHLEEIISSFNPILSICLIIVILNLGAPLNYHLITGAGLFTAVYILARGCGKYFGAWFGAYITKSPKPVQKYLGLTLLPHSGVSLVFTGIAVSVLSQPAPENAKIVQGTIAAAAVINEIIAVIAAKKGFQWAGELNEED